MDMDIYMGLNFGYPPEEIIKNILTLDDSMSIYERGVKLLGILDVFFSVTPDNKEQRGQYNREDEIIKITSTYHRIMMKLKPHIAAFHVISQFINRGAWLLLKTDGPIQFVNGNEKHTHIYLFFDGLLLKKLEFPITSDNGIDVVGRYGRTELYADFDGKISLVDEGVDKTYIRDTLDRIRKRSKEKVYADSKKDGQPESQDSVL